MDARVQFLFIEKLLQSRFSVWWSHLVADDDSLCLTIYWWFLVINNFHLQLLVLLCVGLSCFLWKKNTLMLQFFMMNTRWKPFSAFTDSSSEGKSLLNMSHSSTLWLTVLQQSNSVAYFPCVIPKVISKKTFPICPHFFGLQVCCCFAPVHLSCIYNKSKRTSSLFNFQSSHLVHHDLTRGAGILLR